MRAVIALLVCVVRELVVNATAHAGYGKKKQTIREKRPPVTHKFYSRKPKVVRGSANLTRIGLRLH
jgi:two-component sensor histidine kinase